MSSASMPTVNESVPLHINPILCISNDEIKHEDSNVMDVYEYFIYENGHINKNKWHSLTSQPKSNKVLYSGYKLQSDK